MSKSKSSYVGQYVLVTTEYRGIFFGKVLDDSELPEKITLGDVRNCVSWTANVRGFLGLAATGPTVQCGIGATVPEFTLFKITGIGPTTEKAAEVWKTAE